MRNFNLSIVIPTWNRERELHRSLQSIEPLLDVVDSIEVIITDNASTDNTLNVAKTFQSKYPHCTKVLISDNNNGPVLNWEKGINAAQSPYSLLLFSDDFISIDCIDDFKVFMDNILPSFCDSKINLARLSIGIFNSDLQISQDNRISLSFHDQLRPGDLFTSESNIYFLVNHLLPQFFKLFKRSFSPVSPAGYIISTNYAIHTLKKFKYFHTFLQNGAGIDNLMILMAALKSKSVIGLPFITCCMVASDSSITHTSQQNPLKQFRLQKSYFLSEFLFSFECLKRFRIIGAPIMILSLLRLARVNFLILFLMFQK